MAEQNLRLPRHVSRFVLTLGSTANQNGTALFEGMTVLFLAQFYGVHLALSQQVTVVFICVLGGIGTLWGPALGAVILIPIGEVTRSYVGGSGSGMHLIVYGALKAAVGIRLDAEDEFNGTDLTIHRISASAERETLW